MPTVGEGSEGAFQRAAAGPFVVAAVPDGMSVGAAAGSTDAEGVCDLDGAAAG